MKKNNTDNFNVAISNLLTASAALDCLGMSNGSILSLKLAFLVMENKPKFAFNKKAEYSVEQLEKLNKTFDRGEFVFRKEIRKLLNKFNDYLLSHNLPVDYEPGLRLREDWDDLFLYDLNRPDDPYHDGKLFLARLEQAERLFQTYSKNKDIYERLNIVYNELKKAEPTLTEESTDKQTT